VVWAEKWSQGGGLYAQIDETRTGKPSTAKRRVAAHPAVSDPIGAALRRLHEEVTNEPMPDLFLKLIADIDRKIDNGKD
jgi:hypothetical protein